MNYRDMNAAADVNPEPVLIREATARDRPVLLRLAALDCSSALEGPALIAEVAGDACAAIELTTLRVVADPFRRTAQAAELLEMRAAQIGASLTSSEDARGRHDSSDRGSHARRARGQDHGPGRRAKPALAPAHSRA